MHSMSLQPRLNVFQSQMETLNTIKNNLLNSWWDLNKITDQISLRVCRLVSVPEDAMSEAQYAILYQGSATYVHLKELLSKDWGMRTLDRHLELLEITWEGRLQMLDSDRKVDPWVDLNMQLMNMSMASYMMMLRELTKGQEMESSLDLLEFDLRDVMITSLMEDVSESNATTLTWPPEECEDELQQEAHPLDSEASAQLWD